METAVFKYLINNFTNLVLFSKGDRGILHLTYLLNC
jgi:hypothetical protein